MTNYTHDYASFALTDAIFVASRAIDSENAASIHLMQSRPARARISLLDAAESWRAAASIIRNAGIDEDMARDYSTRYRQAKRAADRARAAANAEAKRAADRARAAANAGGAA